MKEQLSYEHLFHFGLQVSVLPEGHLEMNMMITVMMMILIVNNHVDDQLVMMMIVLRLGSICTGGPGLNSSGAHLKTLIIVITRAKKVARSRYQYQILTGDWGYVNSDS